MAWFNYIKYDVADSELTYLFCYFLFNCNATPEEKAELIKIRDENNGNNHIALDIMYQNLYNRQILENRKKQEQEYYKIDQLTSLQLQQDNIKLDLDDYHQRNLTPEEIDKKLNYKDENDFTEYEYAEMFKQPVINHIKVNEDLTIDVLDRYYGCFTFIFNDNFRNKLPSYNDKHSDLAKQYKRFNLTLYEVKDDQTVINFFDTKISQIKWSIYYHKEEQAKLEQIRTKRANILQNQLMRIDKQVQEYERNFEEQYLYPDKRILNMPNPVYWNPSSNYYQNVLNYFQNREEYLRNFYYQRHLKYSFKIPKSDAERSFEIWREKRQKQIDHERINNYNPYITTKSLEVGSIEWVLQEIKNYEYTFECVEKSEFSLFIPMSLTDKQLNNCFKHKYKDLVSFYNKRKLKNQSDIEKKFNNWKQQNNI